jgi:hypothetical protein
VNSTTERLTKVLTGFVDPDTLEDAADAVLRVLPELLADEKVRRQVVPSMRTILMGTGAVTLDQVDRHAEPLTTSILRTVAYTLTQDV